MVLNERAQSPVSLSAAEDVVRAFLAAAEARDFEAAGRLLAPGAEMTFPGGASFSSLPELAAWAKPRYRRVAKRFERVDAFAANDGDVVVVQGVLHGEWPDGEPFDGIRFVDWFLVREGLIVAQRVWNDLAETGPG